MFDCAKDWQEEGIGESAGEKMVVRRIGWELAWLRGATWRLGGEVRASSLQHLVLGALRTTLSRRI